MKWFKSVFKTVFIQQTIMVCPIGLSLNLTSIFAEFGLFLSKVTGAI